MNFFASGSRHNAFLILVCARAREFLLASLCCRCSPLHSQLVSIGGRSSCDFDETGIQQALVGPPGGAIDLCLEREGLAFGVCLVRSRKPLHSSQVGWQRYLTRSKFPSNNKTEGSEAMPTLPPSIRLLRSPRRGASSSACSRDVDETPAFQDSMVAPRAPSSPSVRHGAVKRLWEEALDDAAASSSSPHGPPPTPNHLFKSPDVYGSYNTKEMMPEAWAEPCSLATDDCLDGQEEEEEEGEVGEQQQRKDYGQRSLLELGQELSGSTGALFYSAKANQCLVLSPTDCKKWAATLPDPDDACLLAGEMLGDEYRIVSCCSGATSDRAAPLHQHQQPSAPQAGRSFVVQHVGCSTRSGDFDFYKAHVMPLLHEPPLKGSQDEEELLPRAIQHPHVMPLHDAFFTLRHLCTVVPLVQSRSLECLIRELRSSPCFAPLSLSPAQLKRHFTAIASGLSELHGEHCRMQNA